MESCLDTLCLWASWSESTGCLWAEATRSSPTHSPSFQEAVSGLLDSDQVRDVLPSILLPTFPGAVGALELHRLLSNTLPPSMMLSLGSLYFAGVPGIKAKPVAPALALAFRT